MFCGIDFLEYNINMCVVNIVIDLNLFNWYLFYKLNK